jgi:EmrB/QacA subfamily drug resistance transporter
MMSIPQPPAAPEGDKWGTMLAVGAGIFMATLDFSIVNVSLPTLVRIFDTDFATIQWVVLAYVLVVTSNLLAVARLGDMLGMKKLYAAGLAIFTLGSLLCGLAPSVIWLIVFRGIQGLGAVMMQALGTAIVTYAFPPQERGKAMGVIGSTVSIGLALGPALGGILIGYVGWRSIFLVNVPIGAVGLLLVKKFVPSPQPAPGQRFDPLGMALMFATLLSYALGMTWGQRRGFDLATVQALLIVAAVGLSVFIWTQRRVDQPMLDLNLFKNPLFSMNLIMGWLVFIVLAGTFILPFFLELVKGYSTEKIGTMMMVIPVCMGVIAPIAGNLADRYGPRLISVIGLAITVGGCVAISSFHEGLNYWQLALRLAPMGVGMGMFQSPNNSAVMGEAPRNRLGVASGLLALSRTLGHSSGLPLMGVVFTAHVMRAAGMDPARSSVTDAPASALVAGISGAYLTAAGVIALSTIVAVAAVVKSRKRMKTASTAESD